MWSREQTERGFRHFLVIVVENRSSFPSRAQDLCLQTQTRVITTFTFTEGESAWKGDGQ